MPYTFATPVVGDRAEYVGSTRKHIFGTAIHRIAEVSQDGRRVRLESPTGFEGTDMWMHINAINIVSQDSIAKEAKVFTDAVGGPVEAMRADLKRYEDKVAELKAALDVIERYGS